MAGAGRKRHRLARRFAYGRIGRGLREGYKTTAPVPCAVAQEIKARVWDEKWRKGYRDTYRAAGTAATPLQAAAPMPASGHAAHVIEVNRVGRCTVGF